MKKHLCLVLCLVLLCGMFAACGKTTGTVSAASSDFTQVPASQGTAPQAATDALRYRALWFSYLDWPSLDVSSESAFAASVDAVFENCKSIGLNCVIVQVRPFGDAIYPSSVYGWSYLCTGTAGQNPGYDPLQIMIDSAHAHGLAFEAWINPYRIRTSKTYPAGEYGADNPALAHPEWTYAVDDGLYYNPTVPEVQQMVLDGVREILENYTVEGIHFDDYFYPTTEEDIDADAYTASGSSLGLADWRRSVVNNLVQSTYSLVKSIKPHVVFGISPQGNMENNYSGQYSDVGLWLSEGGYVDYIMPQVYWGFGYTLSNGRTTYAFENITATWAALPRAENVFLCFGLGAYRIGAGDGGSDVAQWESGHNLADQVQHLQGVSGVSGFAVFRYRSLFASDEYAALCTQEQDALRTALAAAA